MTTLATVGPAPITFDTFLDVLRERVQTPLFVDLGCGQRELPPNFVGVDYRAEGDRIIQTDLFAAPWPFDDESVDAFTSSHFLEHVPSWDLHFTEIYRCLKPGGYYRFVGPYAWSDRYIQDPSHCQPLHERKLWYLQAKWLKDSKIEHDHARVNFSTQAIGYAYHPDYAARAASGDQAQVAAVEWARTHYINVVDDMYVLLKKEPMPEGE